MRLVFLISIFFLSASSAAQDLSTSLTAQQEKDSIRAYYIKRFPDYFFLYPVLKQRSLNFELENKNDSERLVAFKPNNSYSFGMGLYLFEMVFELAFAIPLDAKSISRYGESKARDVQLNVLGKTWGLDAFYQKYTGFYTTDSQTAIEDDMPYPRRSDIVSRNIGLTGNYVFNNQQFSFRSAYNFAERQVFSKGSVLLSASLSAFKMNADSSIITPEQQPIFDGNVSFSKIKYTSFSLAPGYTYSIVFKSFFLNGTLSVGPAHHWIGFKREGESEKTETALNSFVAARIGLGYNGERVFGGITFVTQGSNVKFEDVRFSNNNGSFKILMGYRFREFGVLRKRVWDAIPFKI
jgi:hypothetical protein